jgi:hypothetical protein
VVLLCAALESTTLWAAPPTLEHIFPAGARRGSKTVVTCTGKFEDWPVHVWAPGATVNVLSEAGKLEIALPEDLPSDLLWLRLYNDEGASAIVPLLVGELEEVEEQEPNNAPQEAQAVPACAVTVNGVVQENDDVDAYAVDLKVGQTLVASLDAHTRLGSPMDAMLQITSANGAVLAANHDTLGLDPRLAFTASVAGTHVVRVFAFPAEPDTNIRYRGAPSYIYRLTLTTGPFVAHALPLAVPVGQATVGARGWNLAPMARFPILLRGDTEVGRLMMDETQRAIDVFPDGQLAFVRAARCGGSARVRVVRQIAMAQPTAEIQDDEPTHLVLPSTVTGRLSEPAEQDEYLVTLASGQAIVVAAEAPSLNLPTSPLVHLVDPSGKTVASNQNQGPVQDAVLRHTVSVDGEYQIRLRDRFNHGSELHSYRLSLHTDQANVMLTADVDALVVKRNAPAELPVTIVRHSPANEPLGALTIEAIDLPEGITAEPVVSEAEGETAKKVTLRIVSTGPPFSGPIRVRATAAPPLNLTRFARVTSRYPTTISAIWLTVIGE